MEGLSIMKYQYFSFALLLLLLATCKAQLSSTFYDNTCPNALSTIQTSINAAISQETRMAASLIRSHTIGQAQCFTFRERIYNATDIDAAFASNLRNGCPQTSPNGNSNLAPLDTLTPNSFDNNYFTNLVDQKGLLASDQILFSGGETDSIVTEYTNSASTFNSDFASAMVKMGNIEPTTGSAGQIRRICSAVNSS
ncbi:hypothetical protein F8388_001190 [Cannabis sativa]|uniref:peroxidase n=1 Tax=Cannabis sativa TaxID=3483 RepID=A0A7J6ESC5_CANSA|nr:hypothetical protein F8388_001190 [Cannabis sativa]KAF4377050.1 hypothetical protein G4B88_023836 [Cannabis sativa]